MYMWKNSVYDDMACLLRNYWAHLSEKFDELKMAPVSSLNAVKYTIEKLSLTYQ